MLLLALPIGFALAGFLIGRWWVVVGAMATWLALALFLYLNNGWRGAGWGDFGIAFNVIIAVVTIAAAALGVGVRSFATRSEGGSPARVI
jgi:hypothetical protein